MKRLQIERGLSALAGGVALAVMMHAVAQAQDTASPDASGSDAETTGVEEIVVTAQKRSEKLQKTPIAITALSADRIAQSGIDRPEKLQFSVPSMTYQTTAGFTKISLRGVGTNTDALSETAVGTYQDGVYTGAIIGQTVPTFDLQRIEVLRGPQGTLYGRNTTGGVINYITKDPEFEYGAAGDISYGNYDAIQANLGVTGPLVEDKVALRASFHYGEHDGYYRNIATGERDHKARDIGGRISALIRPSEDLTLIIRADKAHSKSNESSSMIDSLGLDGLTDTTHPLGIFSQPASFFEAVPGLLSPTDIAKLNGGSIAAHYGLIENDIEAPDTLKTDEIANWFPGHYITDTSGVSLTATWDVGGVTIKSISAYRFAELFNDGDVAGVPYPLLPITSTLVRNEQYTQEFNVSGQGFDEKLDWFVGAFYFHDDGYSNTTIYLPSYEQFLQASTQLSNPAGSAYAFNLNPASLIPFRNLPGAFPSHWQTALYTGGGYPLGTSNVAGVTIPETAFSAGQMTLNTDSYAVFAQATWHFSDRLRFTGGLRYTIDEKSADRLSHNNFGFDLAASGIYQAVQAGFLPPSAYTEDAIAAAAGMCDSHTTKKWEAPTGMINVDYDLAPRVLTYAKVSWGYKAGGMNTTECNTAYNPEYLTDYEAGVKAVLADGQILANLAAYYYDYTDIQFLTYTPRSSMVSNAGSATAFGVELEYALRPNFAPDWQLDGSVSYQDSEYGAGCFGDPANLNNARYLSNPIQDCPATVVNPTTGQVVPIAPSANIRGNQLIRSPRWKFNAALQYDTDIGANGNILARLDATWTDKMYNDILNSKGTGLEKLTQPGFWMLSGVIAWKSPDDRYAVELFGDNLTDSRYLNTRVGFNTPPTVVTVSGQLAAPRTFGVRFRANF